MANVYDPKALVTLPGRSKFDLSYRNTFTAKMSQLIPALCKPVVPGDRFRVGLAYQMQLAPMLNPVYDGLTVNFEAFFVPNRILDPKWREFWTGYNQYDQMTAVDIAPLKLDIDYSFLSSPDIGERVSYDSVQGTGVGVSSLLDYLGYQFSGYNEYGLPTGSAMASENAIVLNAYPVLGYNRIFDDWYRNERTQRASLYQYYNGNVGALDDRNISVGVGVYNDSIYFNDGSCPIRIHQRNYAKDRFTTALPEPIIGGDVRIPVGESFSHLASNDSGPHSLVQGGITQNVDGFNFVGALASDYRNGVSLNSLALGTIQQLKLAFKEYEYRMKDTYNGNRYVESIESHYGVRVPDSTLQRSLYLGSTRDYVNFGEVYQTSAGSGTDTTGALGDYAGRGNASGSHFLFDETFYEPGYIYVIFSVSPKSRYFQGVQRHLVRYERDDYFSPEYQNIGDDFIETREIFNNPWITNSQGPESVFGYQTRWYDLKSYYDECHGDFANVNISDTDTHSDTQMMTWLFSRYFNEPPTISDDFSKIPVINRPFVDMAEYNDNYFVDIAFNIDALRPILTTESF